MRNDNFGNGSMGRTGVQILTLPQTLAENTLYLEGGWDIQPEYATNLDGGAKIVYRFNAQDVYLVAGAQEEVRVHVYLDGEDMGFKTIQTNTLTPLITGATSGWHTLEIIVNDDGLEAYTFTFG